MSFKGIYTCILVSTMLRKIDREYEEQCIQCIKSKMQSGLLVERIMTRAMIIFMCSHNTKCTVFTKSKIPPRNKPRIFPQMIKIQNLLMSAVIIWEKF